MVVATVADDAAAACRSLRRKRSWSPQGLSGRRHRLTGGARRPGAAAGRAAGRSVADGGGGGVQRAEHRRGQPDLPGPRPARAGTRPLPPRRGPARRGSQHSRRTVSGARRFSTGSRCSSATAATAVRRGEPGRRRGLHSPQLRGHGGLVRGLQVGQSASGRSSPARIAGSQVEVWRRSDPAAPDRQRGQVLGAGRASAALTIAASGSTWPGAHVAARATASRRSHRSRTTASCRRLRTLCKPDVRRHGSTWGGGGGGGDHRGELLLGPLRLPCRRGRRPARRAARPGPPRRARRSAATARAAARVDQSAAEWPFSRTEPEHLLDDRPRPTFREPGEPPASSVSKSRAGAMPSSRRQGRSCEAACSTHSSSAMAAPSADRSGSARVHQHGAPVGPAQLDQIGPLPVAVAGGRSASTATAVAGRGTSTTRARVGLVDDEGGHPSRGSSDAAGAAGPAGVRRGGRLRRPPRGRPGRRCRRGHRVLGAARRAGRDFPGAP